MSDEARGGANGGSERPTEACLQARLAATALLDGEATDSEARALRGHLATCEACRTVVGRHESLVAAVRAAPLVRPRTVPLTAPRPGLRRTGTALLVAACLALVALVGALVSEARRDGGPAPAPSGPLIAERPTDSEPPPG